MDHDASFGEEHQLYTQDPLCSNGALRNHHQVRNRQMTISLTLESAQIVIHGAGLKKFENRELKDIRRTWFHVSFCFVGVFFGCTSTGRVGLWFLWFYVQEHRKMYHVTSTMFA